MKSLIILIAIIFTFGLILFVISSKRKKSKILSAIPATIIKKDITRDKIIQYFKAYQSDISNFELYNFYSRQFDIKTLQKDYVRNVEMIENLADLQLNEKEYEIGNKFLIEMAKKILGHENINLRWGDALNFLHEYKRLSANLDALKQIQNQIVDFDRYNNYLSKINSNIQELIQRTTNQI